MSFFDRLLGRPRPDLKELILSGAIILDVRTSSEYATGHIRGSVNISVDVLPDSLGSLKKELPVITCCASGIRSSKAKNILRNNGFTAYNGGSWASLRRYMI